MIQTVLGILKEEDVKISLAHEHFEFGYPGLHGDEKNHYDRAFAKEECLKKIALMKHHDVNLVVDMSTIECGRDPELLMELSKETGLNIVAATGIFKDEGNHLSFLKSLSYICDLEEYLSKLFISEIQEGIGNTGCKAGIIKIASSLNEIKPLERVVFIAAAKAQKETGVPIYTHSEQGTMGLAQAKLLIEHGADPGKIIIGHMNCNRDFDELEDIMRLGVNIGFDQFSVLSVPNIPSDEEKTQNLFEMLRRGYEDQIVISQDCAFDRMGYISKSKPRFPDFLFTTIIPELKRMGTKDETITKLIRTNLLRIFR